MHCFFLSCKIKCVEGRESKKLYNKLRNKRKVHELYSRQCEYHVMRSVSFTIRMWEKSEVWQIISVAGNSRMENSPFFLNQLQKGKKEKKKDRL